MAVILFPMARLLEQLFSVLVEAIIDVPRCLAVLPQLKHFMCRPQYSKQQELLDIRGRGGTVFYRAIVEPVVIKAVVAHCSSPFSCGRWQS